MSMYVVLDLVFWKCARVRQLCTNYLVLLRNFEGTMFPGRPIILSSALSDHEVLFVLPASNVFGFETDRPRNAAVLDKRASFSVPLG